MLKYLLFFLLFPFISVAQRKPVFPSAEGGRSITSANPSDTFVVQPGAWTYLYLRVKGTPEKPVVVLFESFTQMRDGISVEDCQNIKVIGADKVVITDVVMRGAGVSIQGACDGIDISGLEITNKQYGVWMKNEASCIDSLNYPYMWMNNISFHHNNVHNVGSQGVYGGSTDANNTSRPVVCNGVTKYPLPPRLSNIRIYANRFDSTGRPGIQLSVAMRGNNEIYGNKISNCGFQYDSAQGTGISLGAYTSAYVHDNEITNTFTWGIASLGGTGLVRIENNIIKNSGYLAGRVVDWASNILVNTIRTVPVDSTTFIIKNNIISGKGARQKANIEVGANYLTYTDRNEISGNGSAVISVAPGIKYSTGIKPPPEFKSIAVSGVFTKSCPAGYTTTPVTYQVAAGKYTASTQVAADALAQNDIAANGQAYANANGVCTPAPRTVIKTITIRVFSDGFVEVK